jgi:vacuolar-type H+-ATPase subunit I/STV1
MTIKQLNHLLDYFSELRNEYSVCSLIEEVRLFILKEKCIYHHMNHLRIENNIFIGNVWIPEENYPKVESSLKEIGSKNIHVASGQLQRVANPEGSTPPTYFKSNEFTWAFQVLIKTKKKYIKSKY